ncbi:MAG: NAD(P)/FAD-dependent oxidoreductase [Solirubrobacteraceae bacterium]
MPSSPPTRVVIVGAGFGGLAALEALKKTDDVDVTLIDQHNHHVFTPLIYQVATAMLEPSEIAHPIRTAVRGHESADFRLGRVTDVDLEKREVHTNRGAVGYDYLILGTGSANNYFAHPEIAEASYGINDLGEAVALRNHLLECFERAAWTEDPAEREALLTFVVVGGGPTGVEFAGSLSELVHGILHRDFPALECNDRVTINLIEASEAPLPPFHPKLQKAAGEALVRRRVTIIEGHVETVEEGVVKIAEGGEIRAGTVVWGAGVKAEQLGEALGVELGSQKRVPVTETLQLAGRPEVFVIGDLAQVQQDGGPLPMLAPVAMQGGKHAGKAIGELMAGRVPKAFRYKALPTMATIGRGDAVVQHGGIRIKGVVGWLFWLVVHIGRIAGVHARLSVAVDWITAFVMRDRPMRLIVRPRRPDVDR